MKSLSASEIRQQFIQFFENKGHKHLPSSPLIPYNDPTVLLTTAGMLQFKPIMFGTEKPVYARATTHQKCFRTTDLENVGFSPRHHTFFEMLGNFSFGDYYKADVIPWAWEFLTEVLELPKDKLHVTVYESDDEAYDIWHKEVGIPADHMYRLGDDTNFWAAGETGPCGPCSEIYFDLGPSMDKGATLHPGHDDDNRYLEIWNLVFMEFDRQSDGSLKSLPAKNIDTGMGLERIASVIQGKSSNYDTDLIQSIVSQIKPLVPAEGLQHERYTVALQVIADHARAAVMLIGDGVQPGNEGRGYVLRRIIRRAVRFGQMIGITDNFMYTLIPTILELYTIYPELAHKQEIIRETILTEEERFRKTLHRGTKRLEDVLAELQQKGIKVVPGASAFELYDTYGFPLELTLEIAQEQGFDVDKAGYKEAMQEQVERARSAARSNLDLGAGVVGFEPTTFLGYESTRSEADVLAVLETNVDHLRRVVLKTTPFYAESGGQVSDHGALFAGAHRYEVVDVQKVGEVVVHVVQGEDWEALEKATQVNAIVEASMREETMKHHSVAHLLHQALKDVLGDQVAQAGSAVNHMQVRFDFNLNRPMTAEEILRVEELVNHQIMKNLPVETQVMGLEEAQQSGAVAMFGEKYGEKVRVVSMGAYSAEFCGGTHVPATGTIGSFKIIAEEALAAGVRRVVGVAGRQAYVYSSQNEKYLRTLSQELKTPFEQIPERVMKMQQTLKAQEKAIKALKSELALQQVGTLAKQFQSQGEIHYLAAAVEVPDMGALKQVAENLKGYHPHAVVVLGAEMDGKVGLVAAVSKSISGQIKAGQIIKELSPLVGAKGGGKPEFAQAGGGNDAEGLTRLNTALEALLPSGLPA